MEITLNINALPLQALLDIMSAMFDGAALKIEAGSNIVDMESIVHRLIDGLARSK